MLCGNPPYQRQLESQTQAQKEELSKSYWPVIQTNYRCAVITSQRWFVKAC